MWSRWFSKKEMDTLAELEKFIQSILKKVNASFIGIVGLKGKFKGLDILSVVDKDCIYDKAAIKRFHAKLAEYYLRTNTLSLFPDDIKNTLQMISYTYTSNMEFHIIPFMSNDLFIMTVANGNLIRLWNEMEKIESSLKILQPPVDSSPSTNT